MSFKLETLKRIKDHLADPDNFFEFKLVRKNFETTNGILISIQQSPGHYCAMYRLYHFDPRITSANCPDVEMWCCPHSTLLDEYGDGESPYERVPLEVVASYIDELESRVV